MVKPPIMDLLKTIVYFPNGKSPTTGEFIGNI